MRRFLANPTAHLLVFAIFATVAQCTYIFVGRAVPSAFQTLVTYGWVIMAVLWVISDARVRRSPCYDLDFLTIFLFPFSIVGYCWWSRGWRGLLYLGLFVLLLVAPYFIEQMLYDIRRGPLAWK